MTGIIYKYTSPSGKSYIGQTVRPEARMAKHRRMEGDCAFHRAIKKYGFENFTYEVLVTIDLENKQELKQKLDFFERFYIRKYHTYENGYNMTLGGEGGLGVHHTEEFKKNISDRMKANNPTKNMTDEWRCNISKAITGRKMSDNMKKLTSDRMKANNPMKDPEVAARTVETKRLRGTDKPTEETKRKLSEALKGRVFSEEHKAKLSDIARNRPRDAKGHYIKSA